VTITEDEAITQALRLVLNLDQPSLVWTEDVIRTKVDAVCQMLATLGEPVPEAESVIRQVEARVTVRQDEATSLIDRKGHVEWLLDRKAEIGWDFWDRYRSYMGDQLLMPRQVIWRLDDVTDSILRKLEDPTRGGQWDRRGLVVGQVQSGKTSNYTGLVCKAADAGYKLILVLAGIHNSLRSQTQLRLDEGFLGFDTQYQQRSDQGNSQHFIGAGTIKSGRRLYAASLTTSAENGDFKDAKARNLALPIGDYPVILVVKKHAGILNNIHSWVTGMHGEVNAEGAKKVRDIPLLIIDDEADNASINTGKHDKDTDPTRINQEIRKLLNDFDKSAYVGYTATPFANIYSGAYDNHEKFGDDIFPRSFIESLSPPTNYFGPERVFGLSTDEGETKPLPIFRPIRDYETWMPPTHDRYWSPPQTLPATLDQAVRAFMLTCAARRARGQISVHNSMLIHVTRFQDVQQLVADQIREHVAALKDRLRYGDGDRPEKLLDELKILWKGDFAPTSERMRIEGEPRLAWEAVRKELLPAVEKIEFRTLNGKAKDALEYYERRKEGLNVIAIGGNKLSRGLTLEGLSVSYYLRASKMYDTLMQMGRWFGYRPGYEDVCRLYTTPELRMWYREITLASDELRRELEEMAAQGATPSDYGLRVRTSPAGLSITAANKMRGAQRVRLSFSGGIPESTTFDIRPASLDANLAALQFLIEEASRAATHSVKRGNQLWTPVPGEAIARFFESYKGGSNVTRSRPDLIANYIRTALQQGELTSWTVALISSGARNVNSYPMAGNLIGMTQRGLLTEHEAGEDKKLQIEAEKRYVIRRVMSPPDEYLDLDQTQFDAALKETRQHYKPKAGKPPKTPDEPAGPYVRLQRRGDQALLILYVLDHKPDAEDYTALIPSPMVGFAASFPHSARRVTAEYAVNDVWQQLQLADLEDDPEDDDE
jgi:hypothetical protein